MRPTVERAAGMLALLAAALAVAACNRGQDAATTGSGTPPARAASGASSKAAPGSTPSAVAVVDLATGSDASPRAPNDPPPGHGDAPGHGESSDGAQGTASASGTAGAPGFGQDGPVWSVAGAGTGAAPPTSTWGGPPANPTLGSTDERFVTQAVEHGQFAIEIARLATERAADPLVKAYAQMLLDDHAAANDRLRRIASSHGLVLPAALPEAMKRQVEALAGLNGAEFDLQFVKAAGIDVQRHDIQAFESASKAAHDEQVRAFARSSLPALRKHLATAEKLPGVKARG